MEDFYTARARIEKDYSQKLSSLIESQIATSEAGTLGASMRVLNAECLQMSKYHNEASDKMSLDLAQKLTQSKESLVKGASSIRGQIEKLESMRSSQRYQLQKVLS